MAAALPRRLVRRSETTVRPPKEKALRSIRVPEREL